MTISVSFSRLRTWTARLALPGAVLGLAGATGCGRGPEPPAGAVVVRCEPGTAGARSGLEPGDVVVGWRRGDRRGPISSPIDLALVELEEAPRGRVTLEVRHGRWRRRLAVAAGEWGVDARPSSVRSSSRNGKTPTTQQAAAMDCSGSVACPGLKLAALKRPAASAWCWLKAAVVLAEAGRQDEAEEVLSASAELIADPTRRGVYWELAGDAFSRGGNRKLADTALTTALALHRSVD